MAPVNQFVGVFVVLFKIGKQCVCRRLPSAAKFVEIYVLTRRAIRLPKMRHNIPGEIFDPAIRCEPAHDSIFLGDHERFVFRMEAEVLFDLGFRPI